MTRFFYVRRPRGWSTVIRTAFVDNLQSNASEKQRATHKYIFYSKTRLTSTK